MAACVRPMAPGASAIGGDDALGRKDPPCSERAAALVWPKPSCCALPAVLIRPSTPTYLANTAPSHSEPLRRRARDCGDPLIAALQLFTIMILGATTLYITQLSHTISSARLSAASRATVRVGWGPAALPRPSPRRGLHAYGWPGYGATRPWHVANAPTPRCVIAMSAYAS